MELNDTYREIVFIRTQLFRLTHNISHCLSINICNSFFNRQERSFYFLYVREKSRIDSKCNWLLLKQKKKLSKNCFKDIKPICYYQKTKIILCTPIGSILLTRQLMKYILNSWPFFHQCLLHHPSLYFKIYSWERIFLCRLEINFHSFIIFFYYRHADDILWWYLPLWLIWFLTFCILLSASENSVYHRDDRLNFLDALIINNNKIKFD